MNEGLPKKINLYGLTMIAIGSCIGSGIFRTPSEVALLLPSQGYTLVAWFLGGVIALTGALTFAELGSRFNGSGGIYIFLREAYGNLPAFLFGWAYLTVVTPGALAALSLVFADYAGKLFFLSDIQKTLLALATIISLSVINGLGVHISNSVASIITTLKIAGILTVIFIGVYGGQYFHFDFNVLPQAKAFDLQSAMALALIGVMFSYGGFQHASFVSGEIENANKNLPRALIIGTSIVCFCYLTINYAYMNLLPLQTFMNSKSVAADAISTVWSSGALFATVLISVSVLGTISIYTMSSPRIYFAMANDGLFFQKLAYIHPKYKTPLYSIMVQCIIACVILLFWKTFADVTTYVVFVDFLFLILAASALFITRRKNTEAGVFKSPLYPLTPIVFIAISTYMLFYTLTERKENAIAGLILLALGCVAYYFYKKYSGSKVR